ncbi:MAG: hypothetical protein WCF84_26445 [Anaerolineae bacterium]
MKKVQTGIDKTTSELALQRLNAKLKAVKKQISDLGADSPAASDEQTRYAVERSNSEIQKLEKEKAFSLIMFVTGFPLLLVIIGIIIYIVFVVFSMMRENRRIDKEIAGYVDAIALIDKKGAHVRRDLERLAAEKQAIEQEIAKHTAIVES